ncbi:unannotated protein [freshwater metagenome]|uniref:Unannotated protein n=1 Tax=freshwater metagenome TaxID=449393 RepID=A0A6J7Q4L4_9ZZZZ
MTPAGPPARVVLATRNAHKVAELGRMLADSGLAVELVPLPDDAPDVAETETSFAGNALLKARALSAHTGLPAIADDSGLCVDALNAMPGVLSARWAGRHGDDRANLELLLGQMADVADARRGARFVCAVALVVPGGPYDTPLERVVEGEVEGQLAREPRGPPGTTSATAHTKRAPRLESATSASCPSRSSRLAWSSPCRPAQRADSTPGIELRASTHSPLSSAMAGSPVWALRARALSSALPAKVVSVSATSGASSGSGTSSTRRPESASMRPSSATLCALRVASTTRTGEPEGVTAG